MKTNIFQYYFWILHLTKMDCHQLISYWIAQFALIYPLLNHNLPQTHHKPSTTNTTIEPEIQNSLSTLKPGDTVRIKTDGEKNWDRKGSVIAPNNRPRSYVVNDKGNLIIRNRCQLILITKKFIVKHDYDNIIGPSESTSKSPFYKQALKYSQILPLPPVRTKSVLLRNHKGIWRNIE